MMGRIWLALIAGWAVLAVLGMVALSAASAAEKAEKSKPVRVKKLPWKVEAAVMTLRPDCEIKSALRETKAGEDETVVEYRVGVVLPDNRTMTIIVKTTPDGTVKQAEVEKPKEEGEADNGGKKDKGKGPRIVE